MDSLQAQLENLVWKTSKSPYMKHEYVFGSHYAGTALYSQLKRLASAIHEEGDYYFWSKKIVIYLFLGDYKYWVMWETDDKFTSLNRSKITGHEEAATQAQINKYEGNS